MSGSLPGPVLLFDGTCGLCHRIVRLLLRFDRRGLLRFAPLQAPGPQAYLAARGLGTENFSTLVFVPDWPRGAQRPLLRTAGAAAALRATGHPALAAGLAAVPRRLGDAVYSFVGHMRYRLFGRWRGAPLPRPEWAARFVG